MKRALVMLVPALVAAFAVAAAAATSKTYLVPTSKQSSGFGAFRQFRGQTPDAASLRKAFGRPDSAERGAQQTCVLRWKALGISARTFRVGDPPNPCTSGAFKRARLSDRRWHTAGDIRVGTPAGIAAEASTRACTQALCGDVRGYVFGLHRTDCGPGDLANVIAEVKGSAVVALVVLSRGCE